jgi:hypothetical protein
MFEARDLLRMHATSGVLEDTGINLSLLQKRTDQSDPDAVELMHLATIYIHSKIALDNAIKYLTEKYKVDRPWFPPR